MAAGTRTAHRDEYYPRSWWRGAQRVCLTGKPGAKGLKVKSENKKTHNMCVHCTHTHAHTLTDIHIIRIYYYIIYKYALTCKKKRGGHKIKSRKRQKKKKYSRSDAKKAYIPQELWVACVRAASRYI